MRLATETGLGGKITETQGLFAQVLAAEFNLAPARVFPDRTAEVQAKCSRHMANVNFRVGRQRLQSWQIREFVVDAFANLAQPNGRAFIDGGCTLHLACQFHYQSFNGKGREVVSKPKLSPDPRRKIDLVWHLPWPGNNPSSRSQGL